MDSILEDTSPILLSSSENLSGPSIANMHRMVPFHLPSMTDMAASRQQSYLMPAAGDPLPRAHCVCIWSMMMVSIGYLITL